MITFIIGCLILGSIAGFLAGLFGIGGGMVIVPTLVYLLPMADVPDKLVMSVALGTSFSTIVVTAFSAAHRHHKLGNVDWTISKTFVPALMVSVFLSGLVVSNLPKEVMSKIFAVMVLYLAGRMIWSLKKSDVVVKPATLKSNLTAGGIIGALSSMAGIAGGVFIVPYLNSRGIEMKRAIGTSSFCGALLGLAGTLSFMLSGLGVAELPAFTLGYIYLPALLAITATSFFTSKLGASAANVLPVATMKKAFAVLLMAVAATMFFK